MVANALASPQNGEPLHPQHAWQVQSSSQLPKRRRTAVLTGAHVCAHTRVHTHVSRGRTCPVCIPWRCCKYKLPASLRLATEFLLLLVGPGEKQRRNNEGGRVYFFKQPKHGTERFHQQLLSLLCWQPAAGSSLASALICFSVLLNALLPNIYSLIFFLFSFFLPFFPLSSSIEGLSPTPTRKSKAACVEGAPRGEKRDVTLKAPRRGEKNPYVHTTYVCSSLRKKERVRDALKAGNMTLMHAKMCETQSPPRRRDETGLVGR